jgi:hypothetical protein
LEQDFSYYIGIAGSHLNRPTSKNNNLSFSIPPGLTAHGGISLSDKNENRLYGSFAHTRSEASNFTTLGIVYGRNINGYIDEDGDEFQIGAFMRFKDSFAPYVGYKKGNLSVGLNYDITTSELRLARAGAGSLELNLKMMLFDDPNNDQLRKLKCRFILW